MLLLAAALAAQLPPDAAFAQARIDARSDARSLIVATHPDDPYRALALWLRREHGHAVRVLVVTRGAGGQNAVGPELGEELAALREDETRAAAQALDVELEFLGLRDFGYCREAAEALDRWHADEARIRLARSIARFDPDFVWTPHGPAEAHGQKAAVLQLLEQALRLLRGRPIHFFRAPGPAETPRLQLDLRRLDPLQGRSYRELSHAVLLLHRTQGPHGAASTEVPSEIAFAGSGVLPSEWRSPLADEALVQPDADDFEAELTGWLEAPRGREAWPEALATRLGRWRALAARLPAETESAKRLGTRIAALERALRIASRVRVEGPGTLQLARSEQELRGVLRLFSDGAHEMRIEPGAETAPAPGLLLRWETEAFVLRPGEERELTFVLARAPEVESELPRRAALELPAELLGQKLRFDVPFVLHSPPELQIAPRPKDRFLVPADGSYVHLSLAIRKESAEPWSGELAMLAPGDVVFLPESNQDSLPLRVDLPARAIERWIAIRVRLPDWRRRAGQGRLPWISARFGLQRPGHEDFAASCDLAFRPVGVRVPKGLSIGIVRGPDDTVEEALRSFGLGVVALDERTLARVVLDDYDTVLIDSRALQSREDAVAWIPRFLAYARRGGHLVVLYHKDSEFNENVTGARLAPFALELGKERITREDAPVRVLLPEHRLLTVPNRILAGDWDGWVQERGLYLPESGQYDERFDELLEIREVPFARDSGLSFAPQRGALLYARTGQGSYVYCALVLHRQLRAYHAGVARLLLNLVTPHAWTDFEGSG